MKTFVGKYPNHYCDLRSKQMAGKTFGRRILDFFKKLFLISEFNYRSFVYFKSRGDIYRELSRQVHSGHTHTIHPYSLPRLLWEYFMVLATVTVYACTPLRIQFCNFSVAKYYHLKGRIAKRFDIVYVVLIVFEAINFADIFLNFFTGYYDPALNEIVLNPRKIALTYVRCEFFVDVLTFLPIESVTGIFVDVQEFAHFNLVFRLFLLFYCFGPLIRFRHYIKYFVIQRDFKSLNTYALHRIIVWLFFFVMLLHWIICICMTPLQVAFIESLEEYEINATSNVIDQRTLLDMTLGEQYVFVINLAFSTELGANIADKSVEQYRETVYYTWEIRIMAVLLSVLMRVLWVYLLILMMEVTTAKTALRTKITLVLYHLKSYMQFKDVPAVLKKRLNRFYLYRFLAYYFRDRAILGRLTEPLRREISMYTCQRLIYNTTIFQSVPKKVMTRIVAGMHREMYFPNDVIVRVNTFAECMYFICSGTVAITTVSDKEITTLEDGDFFGEIALISEDRRRTATVTAVTIAEVYRLEATDFKKIVERYPDVYNRLEKYAIERFQILAAIERKSEGIKRSL